LSKTLAAIIKIMPLFDANVRLPFFGTEIILPVNQAEEGE